MQVLPLRGMTISAASTAADGSVFLASGGDGGIRRLAPVPFRQQAEALADAEEFQEALQLATFIPDSQVPPPLPYPHQRGLQLAGLQLNGRWTHTEQIFQPRSSILPFPLNSVDLGRKIYPHLCLLPKDDCVHRNTNFPQGSAGQ